MLTLCSQKNFIDDGWPQMSCIEDHIRSFIFKESLHLFCLNFNLLKLSEIAKVMKTLFGKFL